jgi:DDE_Tnp_1-associated
MKSFERFLALLARIPDPRRAEGKLYQLPHVLLFSILAIVSGANSYRGIRTFIKVHRQKLNKAFKISWKRPPAHTAIRYILQGLEAADVEKAFREHAGELNLAAEACGVRVVALDGKALKGSFDSFNDAKAKQMLSAFAVDTALVLAHIDIDEKSNEIPAAQKLLEDLDLAGHIVTCDAIHCQKNLRNRGRRQRASDRATQGQPADPATTGRGRLLYPQPAVCGSDAR